MMSGLKWMLCCGLLLSAGCDGAAGAAGDPIGGVDDSKWDSVTTAGIPCSGTLLSTGCECQPSAECAGVCLNTDFGAVCASSCEESDPTCPEIFPGGCPTNWRVVRTDETWHCLPPYPDLCRPCVDASDCEGTSASLCISYGVEVGQFCGGECSANFPCPPGYQCLEVGTATAGAGSQCVRTSGVCDCSVGAIADGLTTTCYVAHGAATCEGARMCTPEGLTPCVSVEPGCGDATEGCVQAGDPGCVVYFEDADGDGHGVGEGQCLCAPEGVFSALKAGDCVDGNPTIHPGQVEACNGADDDCDGQMDEDSVDCANLFLDLDGDGHGGPTSACVCPGTPGHVASNTDCDDTESSVHPGAVEVCGNSVDEDCVGGPDMACGISACYPGANDDWTVCVDLVDSGQASSLPAYQYADPAGSPNASQYKKPGHYLDLSATSPDLKLAKNFVLSEFMSAAKGKYGVFQPHAVDRLQQVRDILGKALHITSGYRSPGYNASIDGASDYSRHMYGDAVDCHANGATTLAAVQQACANAGVSWSAGPPVYESHVHCDWRNETLDSSFYGALGGWVSPEWVSPPQGAEIVVELVDGGQRLRLTAEPEGYDEGIPVTQWVIGGPAGVRLREGMRVEIDRPESGEWWVDLVVGMNASASIGFEL